MPEKKPAHETKKRIPLGRWAAGAAVLVLGLWLVHSPVLSWAARKAIVQWCAANKLSFSANRLVIRLDGPVVLEEMSLRSTPGSGRMTSLDIAGIELRWGSLGNLFAADGRLIRELAVHGVSGVVDSAPGQTPAGAFLPSGLLRWVPQQIHLSIPSLDILTAGGKLSIRDLKSVLSESAAGDFSLGKVAFQSGAASRAIGPVRGETAWKYGTLWLAGAEVLPGLVIDNLSLELLRDGGPSLSVMADCFGGSLRGDAAFTGDEGTVDVALWASNIPIERMAATAELSGKAGGTLAEGRLTYRGRPDRPSDAEASLRLVAEGFVWNKRGWESLEVGASLIHRRLVVSGFDLRQKSNLVRFSGEVSLAEGWSEIARSPFLVNLQADIREMGALAGLLGEPLNESRGRMTATGSISGRAGRVDGFLSLEGSDISFRSLPPASVRAEAVFRDGEMEISKCELFSGKDTAAVKGAVSQASPHQYSAEINARIADLAVYLAPFHAPGAEKIYGGAMDLRWQGDGTAKSHSGAFDARLKDFVSGATPAGLTGEFTGTYSPNNIYFSKLRILKGPLKLDSHATFAGSGVTLKDVELSAGNTMLLEGAAFVPVNVFAILGGTDWRAAIDADREAYLRAVTPKDLGLGALLQLTGQTLPLDGQVRLNIEAGGPAAKLTANGTLTGRDLVWKDSGLPPSQLNVNFESRDGAAKLAGKLETRGFQPFEISAAMPFGLAKSEDGDWRWLNPTGRFEAALNFPNTDLGVFRPFLPQIRKLKGALSGKLDITGTVGAPKMSGSVALKGGALEVSPRSPGIANANATLAFDGTRMQVQHFHGDIGAGPFTISGSVGLADPSNPAWDLRFKGEKILLARDAGMRLRANVDLTAAGNNGSGAVRGSVRLVDGRVFRRFEITPLLLVAPEDSGPDIFQPPAPQVAAPFSNWNLDIKVTNETPFLIRGNIAEGELVPDVTLTGTLSRPVPVGRITLKDVQAFLPFTTMTVSDGRVDFLPDSPWIPMLDVRGTARTPDYEIHAYAFGPLNERKLILRSEPPLDQESLVLLLTTGISGNTAGAGFGEAAAGQGGLFLLRSFARQLDLPGIDSEALLNRLNFQAVAPRSLGERASMRGRLRLINNLDLMTERDGYGFFNAGVTYTWRFQ